MCVRTYICTDKYIYTQKRERKQIDSYKAVVLKQAAVFRDAVKKTLVDNAL